MHPQSHVWYSIFRKAGTVLTPTHMTTIVGGRRRKEHRRCLVRSSRDGRCEKKDIDFPASGQGMTRLGFWKANLQTISPAAMGRVATIGDRPAQSDNMSGGWGGPSSLRAPWRSLCQMRPANGPVENEWHTSPQRSLIQHAVVDRWACATRVGTCWDHRPSDVTYY